MGICSHTILVSGRVPVRQTRNLVLLFQRLQKAWVGICEIRKVRRLLIDSEIPNVEGLRRESRDHHPIQRDTVAPWQTQAQGLQSIVSVDVRNVVVGQVDLVTQREYALIIPRPRIVDVDEASPRLWTSRLIIAETATLGLVGRYHPSFAHGGRDENASRLWWCAHMNGE